MVVSFEVALRAGAAGRRDSPCDHPDHPSLRTPRTARVRRSARHSSCFSRHDSYRIKLVIVLSTKTMDTLTRMSEALAMRGESGLRSSVFRRHRDARDDRLRSVPTAFVLAPDERVARG